MIAETFKSNRIADIGYNYDQLIEVYNIHKDYLPDDILHLYFSKLVDINHKLNETLQDILNTINVISNDHQIAKN